MKKLIAFADSLLADEAGATIVEYAVMLALIAAVSIGVTVSLGNEVKDGFEALTKELAGLPGG